MRELTSNIISAAIEVHRVLGPGLLEKVYQRCLQIELQDRGFAVQSELDFPAHYKGRLVDDFGFRMDLLVEDKVIVEVKSQKAVEPVHKKQLLTYLRQTEKEIGLLINFNVVLLKDGLYRVANSYSATY